MERCACSWRTRGRKGKIFDRATALVARHEESFGEGWRVPARARHSRGRRAAPTRTSSATSPRQPPLSEASLRRIRWREGVAESSERFAARLCETLCAILLCREIKCNGRNRQKLGSDLDLQAAGTRRACARKLKELNRRRHLNARAQQAGARLFRKAEPVMTGAGRGVRENSPRRTS